MFVSMREIRGVIAIIEREGDGYAVQCAEFDVVSQGDAMELFNN